MVDVGFLDCPNLFNIGQEGFLLDYKMAGKSGCFDHPLHINIAFGQGNVFVIGANLL